MNEEYVRKRNRLIREAEKYANEKEGIRPARAQSREEWQSRWNTSFHDEMNELAEQKGLGKKFKKQRSVLRPGKVKK